MSIGLLHGLGFAGALAEVGLPADAIPQALLLFNIGIEIGQLTFVALVLALGHALIRYLPSHHFPALGAALCHRLVRELLGHRTHPRLLLMEH